jgi:hypothetical protein
LVDVRVSRQPSGVSRQEKLGLSRQPSAVSHQVELGWAGGFAWTNVILDLDAIG